MWAIGRLAGDPAQHQSEIDSIRIVFAEWAENKHLLDPLFQNKFLLSEVAPVSESLSKTGAIGLETLQYLESGKRAPTNWVAEQKQELDKMEQPKAEVVLAAVRPVRALLEGISQPNIRTAAGSGDK
jgi:hypothetical protein